MRVTRTPIKDGLVLEFWLSDGIGIAAGIDVWRERFDAHKVVVLGPTVAGLGGLARRIRPRGPLRADGV